MKRSWNVWWKKRGKQRKIASIIRAMIIIALMMEAARTSETLINFYQTTRCYNPEDSHLHTHRRENLKSYLPNRNSNLRYLEYKAGEQTATFDRCYGNFTHTKHTSS
jgi:hypothetical protein